MAFSLRKALGATSAIGLAISLAACGPEDVAVNGPDHFALGDISGPYSWPMDGYDALDDVPDDAYGDWAPLNAARPMVARASTGYGYAPAWDYPEAYRYDEPQFASHGDGYYDDGYYDEAYYDSPYFERAYYGPAGYDWYDRSPDTGSYALLALAAVLGGVIGNSPPDYYFDYGNVQPWVWVTDDHYVRYAEPLRTGYRYYYYAPDAVRPFLVRDPMYTYGYSGDRLVVVYDSYGRVLNRDRAVRLRRAATSYYDRGVTLYNTGVTADRYGVAAPLWQQRSATIAADQQAWDRARDWSPGWRSWDKRYDKVADKHWQKERIARSYAASRFASWQDDGYRGAAPQPRKELRTKGNPHQAVMQQAAIQLRQQQNMRTARLDRIKSERRSNGNQARVITARQEKAVRTQANGQQRRDFARMTQGGAERQQMVQRQERAQLQRKQTVQREQAVNRQQAQRLQAQNRQKAQHQQVQRQQPVRQKQAQRQQVQRQQAARQQQAQHQQVQRQQVARQQQAQRQQVQRQQVVRQQQAQRQQAQRQQAVRQQQAQRQQVQRQQVVRQQQAQRQQVQRQQVVRQQQAQRQQAQRQQVARQQQPQRQQAQRQSFASNDPQRQVGQNNGNGRKNR